MRDSYVSLIIGPAALVDIGAPLFRLNYLELEKNKNNIDRELALLELTEIRLSPDYLREYVMDPLMSVQASASSYYSACMEIYELTKRKSSTGTVRHRDLFDIQAQSQEAGAFASKSNLAVLQKQVDIEGQRRRMAAERNDLVRRSALIKEIKEIHTYRSSRRCKVTWEVFDGSFVEAGDIICTLSPI